MEMIKMKIGFLSLPVSGHLNPMTALARKLQARGNDVVFISVPDAEAVLLAAGLQFVPFCEQEYPVGTIAQEWSAVSKLHGFDVVRHSVSEMMPRLIKAALDHLPGKIAEAGVEALVIDTIYFYTELVAMQLGIPYVHVWNVLPLDFSGATPAPFFGWPHQNTPEALARNIEGLQMVGELFTPLVNIARPWAERAGLQVNWNDPGATRSKLAAIAQTPREFDYPNIPWPPEFHYTGPFHDDEGRQDVSFPWEKLTGAPLVYASLGTLVNGLEYVYRTIMDAVRNLSGVQVVLSVGRNVDIEDLGPIPSNTIVVTSAPQIELLKRARVCITHAGLNTTLETLAQGVPMVAIPIGYEQPGIAARISWHGVGEVVDLEKLNAAGLSNTIQRVWGNQSYRDKARHMQKVIAQSRGLERAAEVIEEAFGLDLAGHPERAELYRSEMVSGD
jgi:zeaxanthin glucosyltransferase